MSTSAALTRTGAETYTVAPLRNCCRRANPNYGVRSDGLSEPSIRFVILCEDDKIVAVRVKRRVIEASRLRIPPGKTEFFATGLDQSFGLAGLRLCCDAKDAAVAFQCIP